MSLQKTVTVSQDVFSTIPGRGVKKDPEYYKAQVIAMLAQMGAEEYGYSRGDIVFSLNVDVADGSKRFITFRIRPVLIQVATKRGGKTENVPRPDTSWYLLWKLLEAKIAAIRVGIVEAHNEMMQYIQIADERGEPRTFAEFMDYVLANDRLQNLVQLEDKR